MSAVKAVTSWELHHALFVLVLDGPIQQLRQLPLQTPVEQVFVVVQDGEVVVVEAAKLGRAEELLLPEQVGAQRARPLLEERIAERGAMLADGLGNARRDIEDVRVVLDVLSRIRRESAARLHLAQQTGGGVSAMNDNDKAWRLRDVVMVAISSHPVAVARQPFTVWAACGPYSSRAWSCHDALRVARPPPRGRKRASIT